MPAQRGDEQRSEPGDAHRLPPRDAVAEAAHHRDAGDVLGGHGDDVQRQRDPDHRLPRPRGGGERERGQQVPGGHRVPGGHDHHDQRHDQCGGHRPAGRPALQHQPGQHDRRDHGRGVGQREDGLDAQRQQDAGQHRPGQGRRDRGHEVAEPGHQPGQHDQDARRHERADRGGPPALDGAGGHQERGARGGPGQRDRGAVPQREPEHPQGLGDAERQQTRRRLGRGGADGGQPGEHDDEGGGEPDDGRDHPRGDRGPLLVHGVSCEVVPFRLRNRL